MYTLKLILFNSLLCQTFLASSGDNMIGPGKWRMLKMEKKTGNLDEVEMDITQRKYNRTHDCFQGSMTFHEDLSDVYGARIDVCKFVDGGCKQFQVLSDESFPGMVATYAEENFKSMLRTAGVEKPEFPIAAGTYEIPQYWFNYDELPPECPYGHYIAVCCAMKGTVEVGCLSVDIEFVEKDDSDEDGDDE